MAASLLPQFIMVCFAISIRGSAAQNHDESCPASEQLESVSEQALLQKGSQFTRHSDTTLPVHRKSLLTSEVPQRETLLEEHRLGHAVPSEQNKTLPIQVVNSTTIQNSSLTRENSTTDSSEVDVFLEGQTGALTSVQDIHLLFMACVFAVGIIMVGLVNKAMQVKQNAQADEESVLKEAHAKNFMRVRCDWLIKDGCLPQQPKKNTLDWQELLDAGISLHMRACPKKFRDGARHGIPPEFRWQVWKAAVKYSDQKAPSDYGVLCRQQNVWSEDISVDVRRTFPDLEVFDKSRQEALSRVLTAYANLNPEVGYCQWMCFPIGLLLLVSEVEEESCGVFVCLMDHMGLSGFYAPNLPLIKVYASACDQLMMEAVPKLRDHLLREGVEPAMYFLNQWFLTLFIDCLPLKAVPLVWDIIFCHGLPVILSVAVAILEVLEDSLLVMEFDDIAKCLNDLKRYESEQTSIESYSIAQIISKLGQIELPPQYILEMLPACSNGETCPSGHPMVVFRTPHGSFACDMCGRHLQKGSALHGCRDCNFDMCQKCLEDALAEISIDAHPEVKERIDEKKNGFQARMEQCYKEKENE